MKEIRSLTGLRGIAALVVFVAHVRKTLSEQGLSWDLPTLVDRLFLMGGRQVDIFFVLSGFILALTYRAWFEEHLTRAGYLKFLQRRFARIYPLHLAMLLAVVAMVITARLIQAPTRFGLDRFDFAALPEHLLLLHAWNLFGRGEGVWNPPSWSISIEAAAYVLFPLFIWLTAGWSKRWPWLVIAGAVAVGVTANALTSWNVAGIGALARGLTEFALGCAVAPLVTSRTGSWLQSGTGSLAALGVLILGFALTPDTGFIIGIVTAPLLLALCGENAVGRALGSRVAYFLGEISYSVYLGHFLFASIAYRIVSIGWMKEGPLETAAGLAFIALFVLVLSTVSYYVIEKPCRDILSGRRKAKAAGTSSVTKGVSA